MRDSIIKFVVLNLFLTLGCRPVPSGTAASSIPENNIIKDSSAEMPDSVTIYLQSALDTMRRYSIKTNEINWDDLEKNTFKLAQGALTYPQTYPAIREAIKNLADNHSFLKTPQQHKQWVHSDNANSNTSRYLIGRMTDEKYGIISIRSFSSGNPDEGVKYAVELQQAIKELDRQNPVAWIIDLRYNRGGNMWPMLAGIGPLLESEDPLGSFITADNKKAVWKYSDGKSILGNQPQTEVPNAYRIKNNNLPVAIFTSSNTASSGEAIAISFLGRPKTRIFGEPTDGLSTANSDHTLKDGAQLILTSAVFADRTGKRYGFKIIPHEDLSEKWYYLTGFEFVTLKGLVDDWLTSIN